MNNYGSIELTVASPPQSFVEPISLAQVRSWLGITETEPIDTEQDAMLNGFISAARNVAESEYGRHLVVKQFDLHLDSFSGAGIDLGQYPMQSVDLVQYTNSDGTVTALTATTDYIVDASRHLILPAYGVSWPSFTPYPSSAVLIRFTSGYPPSHPFWAADDGQTLIQGMKILIAEWHENRLPMGEDLPGVVKALFRIGARQRVH